MQGNIPRMRRWDRPYRLAEYLSRRDVSCPGCGYNLRGLVDEHCPECGQDVEEVTLRLLSSRPSPVRRFLHGGAFELNLLLGVTMFGGVFLLDIDTLLIYFYLSAMVAWLVSVGTWGMKDAERVGAPAFLAWAALIGWILIGTAGVSM